MNKYAVYAGLGDYYADHLTGYSHLVFTLQNVYDFSNKLRSDAWINSPLLADSTASKNHVINKLIEAIDRSTNPDDWLLFFYSGHASRHMIELPTGGGDFITYCVTYSDLLSYDYFPGVDDFFNERDYNNIIDHFKRKIPNGHLITVLDCCHAFGMIERFGEQTAFHTIIAASSDGVAAHYNTNSSFFQAFSACWNLPFNEMDGEVKRLMQDMGSPNIAQVQVAANFINQHL